jgi:hypothetical protein
MSLSKFGVVHAGCAFALISVAGCSSSSGDTAPESGSSPTDPGGGGSWDPTGTGATTGASGPVRKADFQTLGAAYCGFYDRCSKGFVEAWFTDAGKCTASLSATYEQQLTQPGVSISRSQLNACLAQLKTEACGADPTACTFKGTAANGAACSEPEQCASGSCFQVMDPNTFETAACGTCQAFAPANGDCSQAECAQGATCIDNVCKPDVTVDGACDDDTLLCSTDLACVGGKCVKVLAENADCTTGDDAVPCDYHLVCTNGKCIQPTITFAGVGEACGVDEAAGTSIGCRASHCSKKKCVPFIEAGQPCDDTDFMFCSAGLSCRDGKCVADDPSACR